jgi:hypothetical protein
MTEPADNYAIHYADKLWDLLPAVYRAQDTDEFGANGPLRELVNRIGNTAAELRRGIDRLWEDQSVETCDDWVIPYIGQLLDTRLVLGLDARGQRLDVANTIDYRRRKGTLGVLEQLASDITGWDVRVVEFFRRLGRTRHGLDPPIGPSGAPGSDAARLQQAEGIIGPLTRTPIGGFADLRNVYGAQKSRSAFDEFFHTADTRMGHGVFGWHAIPHLGVFVWRLVSLAVGPVTPVAVSNCPGWYCFDPTGRDVPLFAARRARASFGAAWRSPREGELATPISQSLLDADIKLGAEGLGLYPKVLSVREAGFLLPAASLKLRPARGRFHYSTSPPFGGLAANYCYGFPSLIGGGPYDRRGQEVTVATPAPNKSVTGGGNRLATPGAIPGAGTVTLEDSLTYARAAGVNVTRALTLKAANKERPLVRLDADWVITGTSSDASLALDGIFVSGGDIVLKGKFAAVTLTCCTLDPGSAMAGGFAKDEGSPPLHLFQRSADGRDLVPTRLWIDTDEAIPTITIDRCVLGPVRTRGQGKVETIRISNSVVQGIRTAAFGPITAKEVKDPNILFELLHGPNPVSALLRARDPRLAPLLTASPPPSRTTTNNLLARLNRLIADRSLYDSKAFERVPLSAPTQRLLALADPARPAPTLNRLLLEDAYPLALADAALAFADGTLVVTRCTVLGRVVAHALQASECILQDLAQVDDRQHGCVRFCAWADGSKLPRQYESVTVAPAAPLFTGTDFGQPGYAQLLETADLQRLPSASPGARPQNTISAGAADGSEMGAYASDKNPIRARALMLKLQEYMPANLAPVIVFVT